MQVFRLQSDSHFTHSDSVAMAIGNFDGVHLGHQNLVHTLLNAARRKGLISSVMIFEPQPQEYFIQDRAPKRIMNWHDKALFLSTYGVQNIFLARFNQALSALSPKAFIESLLQNQCKAKHLVVGDDFRFGHKRSGDIHVLRQYVKEGCFEVEQAPTVEIDGIRVSSTRVRQALEQGDFLLVQRLLNRRFEISGKVVYGDGLGRQLGFPTANLRHGDRPLPMQGVFAVTVIEAENSGRKPSVANRLPAVANLGVRPTVAGRDWRFEVHILSDQVGNLYGRRLRVRFVKKLRDEKAFSTVQDLKMAVQQDIAQALNVLQDNNMN